MADRISCIVIRTKLASEENRDILYTLRNVLHVAEAAFGYVVTFEEPLKADYVEPFIKACQSFDFVEGVGEVELGQLKLEHHMATTKAQGKVFEFLNDQVPRLADYGDDLPSFSADIRAWQAVCVAIQERFRKERLER